MVLKSPFLYLMPQESFAAALIVPQTLFTASGFSPPGSLTTAATPLRSAFCQ